MKSRFWNVVMLLTACCGVAQAEGAAVWPGFRGADARGVSPVPVAESWSATESVSWKTDIPGRGWSSPIVWGDRIFLSTVVSSGAVEAPKKGLYFGGERPDVSKDEHQWKVICLERASGKIAWDTTVRTGTPVLPVHVKNSYASETPVTDGKHVYVTFGGVGIYCLDVEGNLLWSHALEPQPMRYNWGTAAGPALYKDRLYYVNDNETASYIAAIDAATGKEVWRTARDEKSNWSPPYVWEHDGQAEIVTTGSVAARSYGLDGTERWSLRGHSSIVIAQPYSADGLLYLTSGYVGDKSKPVYAIRPGATGDITLAEGQTSNEFIAWSNTKIGPYNPSTLVADGLLYVLYDRGMLSCYDAKTGEVKYERQKLEGSAGFTVSPWAAGGKIYCLDEDGKCYVLKAGDTFELLRTNTLAADDMCMATPALVDGQIILRTAARVYAFARP